ncbi:organic cation transporter protein [Bombyx mori]|uniref:Major facilitator superfamily (MFS) profile domain-containing protein n=1 Tax=Bombyx mori TaxID=7091 RepID=A0A8R2G6U9_BOMMO|nr:organic cation transporter protein-like [Bombyx mori]
MIISELIGKFGKYQFWICVLIFANKFGVAFHQMAIVFLAPPAVYYCPGNATCCDSPAYNTSLFTRTIVTEWNLICEKSFLKDITQTLFQFGVLFGSLVFGIISDRYGRKSTLITSVVLEVITGIMSSFMPDFWSFTIIRMILGISVGGIMVVGFVIVMEYVGNDIRYVISALYHVPFTLGHMLLALFGYYIRDYMYYQLAISVVNVFLLIYICVLPESPRWLLAVNKTFEAITLIERIAKTNNMDIEDISTKIELFQLEHKPKKSSVLELFRSPNLRKNILIMSFNWLVSSYCFYGVTFYISHLTGDIFINVAAMGCVCLCGCLIAIPILKFMNRKTIVILGNVICSISILIIAFVPEGIVSIVFGCIGVMFSFMLLVIVYLYCSEMFPTVVRNAAIGISSMSARMGSMIAPFVAALRPYGQWCAPVGFGIFPLVAALLCILLPETKDCELMTTIEEGEAFGKSRTRNSNGNEIT